MPAAIRSALAAGKALAARPAKAATRRHKSAHAFTFALQPARLAAVPAGVYKLHFMRGVKVACTVAVEATAAGDGGDGVAGRRWPPGAPCHLVPGGWGRRRRRRCGRRRERRGGQQQQSGHARRSRGRQDAPPPGSSPSAAGGFDAKDAKLSLLRVCPRTRTESTVGKAHFDLAAHARVPSGVTPLELHLTGGAVVELSVDCRLMPPHRPGAVGG
eukprot:TRINITY_DN9294_c0_g1_i1.p3 TRINITY_DN9294_c0_g1~~TRINITY_DN9294_c0_g1_i1.p3  ORF type:complete len:215 (-),score=65.30 TRINITY_DN9294_c0_g1_i1:28-672(-)